MNLATVMDAIATQLDKITGLRVTAYPPDQVQVPAAIVTYPDSIDFDAAYARGMDRIKLPVVVVVGRVYDRVTRDLIAGYCAGKGSSSIKDVVEGGAYTAFDTVRVESIDFHAVKIAGTEYMAATFNLDIAGSGG